MEYNEEYTKRTITVTIDGKNYLLSVPKDDQNVEMTFRKSAEVMNKCIEKRRSKAESYTGSEQDIIVLAMLSYVYSTINKSNENAKKSEQQENMIL